MANPKMVVASGKLNDAQVMLLDMLSRPMTEAQFEALRKNLVDFYRKMADDEGDRIWEERNLTPEDMNSLLEKHPKRRPYNPKQP